jgi:DNA gyrase subunit B
MIAVVSVNHPAPRFEGQTKTKLDNTDVQSAIMSILNVELQLYFDRHLDTLKTIIARAEASAKIRKEEDKIRTNLADKKFAFEGNGKLARQESNKPEECEIFIVEGEPKTCPYPSFL